MNDVKISDAEWAVMKVLWHRGSEGMSLKEIDEAAGDKKGYARVLVKAAAVTGRFIPATSSLIGGKKEVSAYVRLWMMV